MKQTTIQVFVEEGICGATVFSTSKRTGLNQFGESRKSPLPEEEMAWKLIAGDNAKWGVGKTIEPKEGEFDNVDWYKNLSERIERVCKKRKFQTKVRVLQCVPQGYAVRWSMTVYWDKPSFRPFQDTEGKWTLREYNRTSRKAKIISEFKGTLECCGDDLYCYLPDECVPDGYEVYPDWHSVIVQQSLEGNIDNSIWWEFRFKKTKPNKIEVSE